MQTTRGEATEREDGDMPDCYTKAGRGQGIGKPAELAEIAGLAELVRRAMRKESRARRGLKPTYSCSDFAAVRAEALTYQPSPDTRPVGLASCYPTLAELGWGTPLLVAGEGREREEQVGDCSIWGSFGSDSLAIMNARLRQCASKGLCVSRERHRFEITIRNFDPGGKRLER